MSVQQWNVLYQYMSDFHDLILVCMGLLFLCAAMLAYVAAYMTTTRRK